MRGELIRERLHNGERVYGTHVCSLTNPVTAKMQATMEYDFIFICNEHMPIDRTETAMMCQLYAAHGISPIVRISSPDPTEAAMALDGGAQGIVAPYVETVEEAREMVGAVKYRPIKGKMLSEFFEGTRTPSQKTVDFLDEFNRDNYIIIGIESVAAWENLDNLLSVPGVDGVFIGPHDLSVSMEIPTEWGNPELIQAMTDIVKHARTAGVGVGAHLTPGSFTLDVFYELMDEGMNWILYGADIVSLKSHMQMGLRALREHMGDTR